MNETLIIPLLHDGYIGQDKFDSTKQKWLLTSLDVRLNMANLYSANVTNISNQFTNITMKGGSGNVPFEVSYIITTIVFSSVTCPLTILLNVLVIMAVKRRPRLQSYANILLACLAVTDAFTGFIVQPSFILWKIFQLLRVKNISNIIRVVHGSSIRAASICSALHLMLVTCERLVAIKYTMHYPYIVTKRKIKVTVTAFWVFVLSCEVLRRMRAIVVIANLIIALVLISCVLFIGVSYAILYHETVRHQKMIKAQQLPQEEVERFAKESKALKTTVFVVGAVVPVCFVPMAFVFSCFVAGSKVAYHQLCMRTFVLLNYLLNPLIYCWRQKEMRKFVFRISSPAVAAVN